MARFEVQYSINDTSNRIDVREQGSPIWCSMPKIKTKSNNIKGDIPAYLPWICHETKKIAEN